MKISKKDRPIFIALVVGIVLCLGLVFKTLLGAKQPASPPAPVAEAPSPLLSTPSNAQPVPGKADWQAAVAGAPAPAGPGPNPFRKTVSGDITGTTTVVSTAPAPSSNVAGSEFGPMPPAFGGDGGAGASVETKPLGKLQGVLLGDLPLAVIEKDGETKYMTVYESIGSYKIEAISAGGIKLSHKGELFSVDLGKDLPADVVEKKEEAPATTVN